MNKTVNLIPGMNVTIYIHLVRHLILEKEKQIITRNQGQSFISKIEILNIHDIVILSLVPIIKGTWTFYGHFLDKTFLRNRTFHRQLYRRQLLDSKFIDTTFHRLYIT